MISRTLLVTVILSALTVGAQAQAPRGVVYIESNIGHVNGRNSILAYRRDDAGHLTQFGEYLTGGTGVHPLPIDTADLRRTLGPFDSDQNLVFNWDATRIFAVNSGSDTIAVFDVQKDGTLVAVKGSPFPSGGTEPVSIGIADSGNILVVVNKDYDLSRPGFNIGRRQPNYTTLRVNPNGKLIPVPHSTVIAGVGGEFGPGNPTPSQALISPNGKLVFDADTFGTAIHSFALQPNGRLERVVSNRTPTSEFASMSPFYTLLPNAAGRPFVLGLAAHPREPIFYAGFIVEGRMGVFTYTPAGQFQFVGSVDAGFGICWLTADAGGRRVYTSNTLINTISVFDTSNPLHPVKLQDFELAGPPAGSEQMALDVRGEYLYVINQQALVGLPPISNALHVLQLAPDGKIAAQADRVVIPVSPSAPQGVIAR
jgi:6-phosphogluconolactonase (cycloisomerase 2 family)